MWIEPFLHLVSRGVDLHSPGILDVRNYLPDDATYDPIVMSRRCDKRYPMLIITLQHHSGRFSSPSPGLSRTASERFSVFLLSFSKRASLDLDWNDFIPLHWSLRHALQDDKDFSTARSDGKHMHVSLLLACPHYLPDQLDCSPFSPRTTRRPVSSLALLTWKSCPSVRTLRSVGRKPGQRIRY